MLGLFVLSLSQQSLRLGMLGEKHLSTGLCGETMKACHGYRGEVSGREHSHVRMRRLELELADVRPIIVDSKRSGQPR